MGARIYLIIHMTSFVLSCILGPWRGHNLVPTVLGGLALGPFNLLLICLLAPPARTAASKPPRPPVREGGVPAEPD